MKFSKITGKFLKAKDNAPEEAMDTGDRAEILRKSAESGISLSGSDANEITVYDPGSSENVTIHGDILTLPGNQWEIRGEAEKLVIASSHGEIFYSRSHQSNPHVLSELQKIETRLGRRATKRMIDMSSLNEMYNLAMSKSRSGLSIRKSNDSSKMQRDLLAIVAEGAKRNASDIHIIINSDRALIRLNVDGIKTDFRELQPQYAHELLAAAFTLTDVSDTTYQKMQYQSARISSIKTELPLGVQSLRMQFNPLANSGRYLVMRLLYSGDERALDIASLGYTSEQVRQLLTMSARPVGINVISGPTGSGKSTTMKVILEKLIERRNNEINLITIEDPPEYVIRNAQQMPVTNAKTQDQRNEAFTQAIAAGLRSDFDVMMIGEIRDRASADLAVEGALSGHPIYASLHANSAMDILLRLRDMGIPEYNVFDPTIFSGLVGQRLVRRLCPHCSVSLTDADGDDQVDQMVLERIEKMRRITPTEALDKADLRVAGPGCDECDHTGYKGRATIAEVILPDDEFMNFMRANKKSEARKYWLQELDGLDLLGSSWLLVLQGKVSPIDIENTVTLFTPHEAHAASLEHWCRSLGMTQ